MNTHITQQHKATQTQHTTKREMSTVVTVTLHTPTAMHHILSCLMHTFSAAPHCVLLQVTNESVTQQVPHAINAVCGYQIRAPRWASCSTARFGYVCHTQLIIIPDSTLWRYDLGDRQLYSKPSHRRKRAQPHHAISHSYMHRVTLKHMTYMLTHEFMHDFRHIQSRKE